MNKYKQVKSFYNENVQTPETKATDTPTRSRIALHWTLDNKPIHTHMEDTNVGLEANNEGVAEVEIEKMYFIQPTKFNEEIADLEYKDFESWELTSNPKYESNQGMIRIRKEADEYILTTKLFGIDKRGPIETNEVISEDTFESMKKLFKRGQIKRRYFKPIANSDLKWEIDVFFDVDNNQFVNSWVKLDLEYTEDDLKNKEIDMSIPFSYSKVYTQANGNQLITEWYERYTIRNTKCPKFK